MCCIKVIDKKKKKGLMSLQIKTCNYNLTEILPTYFSLDTQI